LNGLYAFGGIYAVGVLGWSTIQLGVFGILASVTGIIGCVLGGWLDNRMGTKNVVTFAIISLLIASGLVISTSATEAFFMPVEPGSNLPTIIFYCAGALIGAAGGALQAASRPLLVDQADPEKIGEAFGLYALSGKATAFLAPLGIFIFTELSGSQRIGITPIFVLFLVGLILLIPVRSKR
ncbi:MAG: MFS transporter, partial [Pseudomonadota bacterium]